MHIMLPEANPKYISKPLYDEIINKIPQIYTSMWRKVKLKCWV
jgi:hypothetical protein